MSKPSFPFDHELAKRYNLMVPQHVDLVGERRTILRVPFMDAVAWPRDLLVRGADKLSPKTLSPKKVEQARARGQAISELPPGAETSWASMYPRTIEPAPGFHKSIRDLLHKAFEKRTFVLYADGHWDTPFRAAMYPVFTAEEIADIFKGAGWESGRETGFVGSFSLLAKTSKMGCFSFNLPAGPPGFRGTCPASALAMMTYTPEMMIARSTRRSESQLIDPARFICNGCYAMKGQYPTETVTVVMSARLELTRHLLGMENAVRVIELSDEESKEALRYFTKERGGLTAMAKEIARGGVGRRPGSFVEVMGRAIDRMQLLLARRLKSAEVPQFIAEEYEEEAAIRLKAEEYKEQIKLATGARKEKLKAAKRKLMRSKPLRSWHIPDPHYFRIHDAGDFFSTKYLEAWIEICRARPQVRFWAPTRVWAVKNLLPIDLLRRIPRNMTVRPSSLHFRQPPPDVHDLRLASAGWGGGKGLAMGSGSSTGMALPRGSWECPAYLHWSVGGGALMPSKKHTENEEGDGGTCSLARGPGRTKGCRACWDRPDLMIFYHEH